MNEPNLLPEDVEVVRKLHALRGAAPRQLDAAAHTQASFMAELDQVFPASEAGEKHQKKRLFVLSFKEMIAMSWYKLRMGFPALAIALATFIFLFGGAGIVASAAGSAVPGDALYGMKTGIEQARLNFAGSPENQGDLFLEFAQRRMDEIKAMADVNRFDEIPALEQDIQRYLEQAQAAANGLSDNNPDAATRLQDRIRETQNEFQRLMEQVRLRMPDDAPPVQPTPGMDDNANSNANGNDANSNANGNDDTGNANDANDNGNANDDDANANANDANTNGNANDDNANGNANINENEANTNDDHSGGSDDANVNDDSSGNTNDNASDTNDSSGNSNDSGSNTNDNSGSDSNDNVNDSHGGNDNGGSGGGNNGNDDSIKITP